MEPKKLLLVGSHGATTGLAIIEEIKSRNLNWEISWIGKKHSGEKNKHHSLEFKIFPKQGVKFIHLESGKIENKFTRYTVFAFLKIPIAFFQALILLLRIRPDTVLSLGGSVGFLISFWSWILKIPLVIHEQTATAGRANIFSAKFSDKIAISRESSKKYFPKNKVILTGNPINKSIINLINKPKNKEVKTILITGGSRGSIWMNNAVRPLLPKLLEKYYIIHQTGNEDFEKFIDISDKKYLCINQLDPDKWAEILGRADICVSRAGANTISELIALKKPSILIPIPWSYKDEQNKNAKYMEELGLARILPQKELTAERLEKEIEKLIGSYHKIIKNSNVIVNSDITASEKIVDIIIKFI